MGRKLLTQQERSPPPPPPPPPPPTPTPAYNESKLCVQWSLARSSQVSHQCNIVWREGGGCSGVRVCHNHVFLIERRIYNYRAVFFTVREGCIRILQATSKLTNEKMRISPPFLRTLLVPSFKPPLPSPSVPFSADLPMMV